ncbi:MAG TPA: type II toxin-antitoxin system ParD family antitoxin [Promineifilum sp.]|nr:type II toxin-antitoxin system ParD family antitoxin [Promineifilum sp.]
MTRLTISMPEQMTAYVEARIAEGRYGNVSEFFRDLVRRDQERRATAIAELRTLLATAEESGIGKRSMTDLIESARDEARQRGLLGDE